MYSDTKRLHDRFTFSLRGTRAVNSYAMVPAAANNDINTSWDARLRQPPVPRGPAKHAEPTRQVEVLLARYFAHGCCSSS
jgi:hypothetical protein